jgi:N-acetylmuramoyl-L-alanine amidase
MRIAIDVGHGSDSPGKRTPPLPFNIDVDGDGIMDIHHLEQYHEHYAAGGVGLFLDAALKRCGFDTLRVSWNDADMTDDENMDLGDRQTLIRSSGCWIEISLHLDASGDGSSFNSASGVTLYVHSDPSKVGDSERLAECVHGYLIQGTEQYDRGIRSEDFAMCNCSAMGVKAAFLAELAFMTNLKEATTMMANSKFWKESAEEICKGICEYAGVAYIEENTDEGDEDEMTQDKFDAMMDDWKKRNDPNYPDLDSLPADWKPIVKELTDAGYINGGTTKEQNPNDVNMTRASLKSVIIMKKYVDGKVNG